MNVPQAIELFNLQENQEVVSPCLVIHGKCSTDTKATSIQIQHPQLPPVTYPVHVQHFKATVILSPGENRLTFVTDSNISKSLTCYYSPPLQNPPVHLCLLVAKDSPGLFDSPSVQRDKEGGNGIDLAVRKLRIGARIMQAFTNEQMLRAGFGHRTFRFEEEYTWDTQFQQQERKRNTVKIHILHSQKTTKEIRDYDIAQQNKNAKNAGGLFDIALDALKQYGGPFTQTSEEPVQAAVVFLDTHWDGNIITAHAALGGGTDDIKLAIFGSHGLYSWPPCIEQLVPYFTDDTRASTKEVANDCNECGTHWECLNVTLGAFMHECGHLLGCPHQEHGVMLRDYVRLNRSFLTKESYSLRTKSNGAAAPIFPKEECTWHRLDLLRFLYHPSFTIPRDYYDPSFMRPGQMKKFKVGKPMMRPIDNETCILSSASGIYCIEIVCGDLAKGHIEYLPQSLGGTGPQKEVLVSLSDLRARIPPDQLPRHANAFKIKILAVNSQEATFDNFPSELKASLIPMDKYGYPPNVKGVKSPLMGNSKNGSDTGIIPIDFTKVESVRVYHGAALDGIRFYANSNKQAGVQPTIPPRSRSNNLSKTLEHVSISKNAPSILFGKETRNFSDVILRSNEYIIGFNVRSGAWVDGIQIVTNLGQMTQVFGKANGGSLSELHAPAGQFLLGVQGRVGRWVDAFGVIYGSL